MMRLLLYGLYNRAVQAPEPPTEREVIKTKIVPLGIGTLMALVVVLGTITPMLANGESSGQISASMTVGSEATIGITVDPTSINFASGSPIRQGQSAPAQVLVTNTGTVQEAISASAPDWAQGTATIPISSMTAQFPSGIGQGAVTMSNSPVGIGTLPSSHAYMCTFIETVPSGSIPGPYSTTVTLMATQA